MRNRVTLRSEPVDLFSCGALSRRPPDLRGCPCGESDGGVVHSPQLLRMALPLFLIVFAESWGAMRTLALAAGHPAFQPRPILWR